MYEEQKDLNLLQTPQPMKNIHQKALSQASFSMQENYSSTGTEEKDKDFKLSDYLQGFAKWNVKTISVNLEGHNDAASTLDYGSESGDDQSLSQRVGRALVQQAGVVIVRRKSSNKRFPLKKKKKLISKQESMANPSPT